MDTASPVVKRKPGRVAKANSGLAGKSALPAPAAVVTSDKEDRIENSDNASEKPEKTEKPEKSEKPKLSAKKQAKKAIDEAIIASGGRGKRTPKPNPKYLDEAVLSAVKLTKDESAESEMEEHEGGDEEMLSSDDYRATEGPLKKRMLHKSVLKASNATMRKSIGNAKGTSTTNVTTGKKVSGSVPAKRKIIEVDIDIDDDHGKQLFLAAKRRLTHSPSNSDDDFQSKKGKTNSPVTDVLAAKLRAKYSDIPGKRTNATKEASDSKSKTANRARISDKSKAAITKVKRSSKRDDDLSEFEQMSAFTIVNINDIMDQNDEEVTVIAKRKKADDTETSEDETNTARATSDHEDSSSPRYNRRKTQHKILSDDKVIKATRKPVTPPGTGAAASKANKSLTTQNRLSQGKVTSTTSPKTFTLSAQAARAANTTRYIVGNKPAILRPPPRILNSTLCKPPNKSTVPSFVTKLVTKDDFENEVAKKHNNNVISSRSKENNVTSYTYTEKDGKIVPKKQIIQRKPALPVVRTQATQQKIITTSVPGNMINNKRIKKITCFETWYVIKMAEPQPKTEKQTLGLSLMEIGNEIKQIELPSIEWSYKILLQPLSKQLLAMRQTKASQKTTEHTEEAQEKNGAQDKESADSSSAESECKVNESKDANDVYTGEVHDPNINPDERHNYRPINIMFRRKCQNPKIRIQFDRTVILKNQTFYLNVDGKNVRLVASPQNIESFDDIQVLLQIVNDIRLDSCCVELATHTV